MRLSVDLTATAHLPAASELTKAAAFLEQCSSRTGASLRRTRGAWSRLAAAYAAPEQHQVHRALDNPCGAGQAVLDAASLAAGALETFAAAVEDIRRRRMALECAAEELQQEQRGAACADIPLPGEDPPGNFLQDRADQLARDLADAEDQCIKALDGLRSSTERHVLCDTFIARPA